MRPGRVKHLSTMPVAPARPRDPLQSHPMMTSRTLRVAGLVLAATMTLASCSSEDPGPSGDPTNGPSSTGSGSSQESSVPADWQEAKIDVAQVHLPSDWALLNPQPTAVGFNTSKDEFGFSAGGGTLTANVGSGEGDVESNIDSVAKFHLETYQGDSNLSKVTRLPDAKINGIRFAAIQWETSNTWETEYITVTPDGASDVSVIWQFTKGEVDRKGAQKLIDPVMKTFELL